MIGDATLAFIPVPNTALVQLVFDVGVNSVENTLYFNTTAVGGWTESALEDLANVVSTWWELEMAPFAASTVNLREVNATDLSVINSWFASTSPTATGEKLTAIMPGNVTLAVSFRTGKIGRAYRGRNYVVGLTEDVITIDTVNSATVSGLALAYADLPDMVFSVNENASWVVVSRFIGNAPRLQGVTTPVTSIVIVDDTVDSQRRRLTGRGE